MLKPDYADAYFNRGNAYAQKGMDDKAIADYSKAVSLKPDDAYVYLNRGVAFERTSLRNEAVADYRAALKLAPTMKEANDGLTRLGVTP